MSSVLHAYEMIPLFQAGIVLGAALIAGHAVMLLRAGWVQSVLLTVHRSHTLASALLAVDFLWIFLLVADIPITRMGVDLDLFAGLKPYLMLLCPLMWILMIVYVKEQLFPRALGLFLLLLVCPFLHAAFLEDPITRLLIPVWAYAIIVLALLWVAKPYLFHRMAEWIVARRGVYESLTWLGLMYGVAVLLCSFLFWR